MVKYVVSHASIEFKKKTRKYTHVHKKSVSVVQKNRPLHMRSVVYTLTHVRLILFVMKYITATSFLHTCGYQRPLCTTCSVPFWWWSGEAMSTRSIKSYIIYNWVWSSPIQYWAHMCYTGVVWWAIYLQWDQRFCCLMICLRLFIY